MLRMKIGDKLAEIRTKLGKSQSELSEIMGVSPSTYSRLENNETYADIQQIMKWSEQLNFPINDVIPEIPPFSSVFLGDKNKHPNGTLILCSITYNGTKEDEITKAQNENIELKQRLLLANDKILFLEKQVELLRDLLIECNNNK